MASNTRIAPLTPANNITTPLLSILIVNFNGRHFLGECLASIHEHVRVPHEVILVDNASRDGSSEYVRQTFPDVRLIASQFNLGFTGGNNLGARAARGRFMLLLNNDTVFRSSIAYLIEKMEVDASIGVLGCRLLYGDGRLQESIGYTPDVYHLVLSWTPLARFFPKSKMFRRTIFRESSLYKQKYADVDWVSGACLLTRSALWKQLGGLDERYFMYMEEVDYCLRVRGAGYIIGYSSACQVTHFEGAGRPWLGERALLNTTDSYMVYVSKFHGRAAVIQLRALLAPVFMMRSVATLVAYILRIDLYGLEKSQAFFHAALKLACGRARH